MPLNIGCLTNLVVHLHPSHLLDPISLENACLSFLFCETG
uniref:Uncharacterized protein n=1 Tax=Populus trichocarpa TaxID=3694 RepID=A9P9D1_POPTR|nr:unknown [Populus trichocarpa]